jgi:PAS domain S-box-containing protein
MKPIETSDSPESKFRQFEALFEHATIGILVTDEIGRIVNFNHYAQEQFGYSREEIMGKLVEELLY